MEILQDGEWHDYDMLVREAGKVIPPGPAVRRNEQLRRRRQGYLHPDNNGENIPDRTRPIALGRAIDSGRRALVRDALINKYFEIDPKGPGRRAGERRRIRMIKTPPGLARAARLQDGDTEAIIAALKAASASKDPDQVSAILDDLHQLQLERVVRHLLRLNAR